MSFLGIDELLVLIRKWEKQMKAYYDFLEWNIRDPRARRMMEEIKKLLNKHLEQLNSINDRDYQQIEYVKYLSDEIRENLIPELVSSPQSNPQEVLEALIVSECKLEKFYMSMADKMIYARSKVLFEMLIAMKVSQIKELKKLLDSYELVF